MKPSDFSRIASDYEKTSLVQNSASDELFELLAIGETEDVMDLGCGTGHISKKIREKTKGQVTGIDTAEGMIREANQKYRQLGINFEVRPAQQLEYSEQFDVIFCNSSFQWFKPPEPVLRSCYQALRRNGRMGIQAPARKVYSPNFNKAVERVSADADTKDIFSQYEEPWFFCDTPEEYTSVFSDVGFDIINSRIDKVTTSYTTDEVFSVFESGAAAGYLDQAYYTVPITQEYIDKFRSIVRNSFENQANSKGKVTLTFFRIYLIARKL